MVGTRRQLKMDRDGIPQLYLGNGDYGKDRNDIWWLRFPKSGLLMSLLDLAHPVKEESGGRITVGGILEERIGANEKKAETSRWNLVAGEWRPVR